MIKLKALTCTIRGLAFSPSGDRLAAVGTTGSVVWDTAIGGAEVARLLGVPGYSMAFTPDGASIAIVGSNANLWHFSTGEVTKLRGKASWYARTCVRICVRPDGSEVCVAGVFRIPDSMDVLRWSLPDQRRLASWSDDETTGGIALSPDGGLLASAHVKYQAATRSYTVVLRDPDDGTPRATLGGSTAPVTDLAFSPDGKHLASIAGITLRVWDVNTEEQIAARKVGTKHFEGFAFTPDGRSLLTVSNDKTVRVWETETWTETSTYEWKIGKATSIAVAPDGLRAAAGGSTGKVILFDLDG